jgi:hypothetical protein
MVAFLTTLLQTLRSRFARRTRLEAKIFSFASS